MAQSNASEVKATKVQRCKPRIVCDSNLKLIENVGKTEPLSLSPSSTENTMAMLQAHGITMLPNDESSIVASAMQSGQKVVLTEAGKMALTLTQSNMMKPQSTLPIKGLVRLPPDMLRGKKVITIRADQLINMKNERKVIIQNPKKQNKLIRETAPSKAKVEVLVTKQIINNQALFTSSFVEKPTEVEAVPTVPMTVVPPGVDSELVRRIGEESELDRVKRMVEEMNRKLEETTKALDLMTEKYLKQVQETEMYKQKVLNSK